MITVLGTGLLVVGLAADPDLSSLPGPAAALGVATGAAIGGYLVYRRSDRRTKLLRIVVLPLAGLSCLLFLGAAATLLNPAVSAHGTFRDAAPALVGSGFALMLLAAILSERDAAKARRAAIPLGGLGILVVGLIGVTSSEPWRPIGGVLVMIGFLIFSARYVYDRFLAEQAPADRAA